MTKMIFHIKLLLTMLIRPNISEKTIAKSPKACYNTEIKSLPPLKGMGAQTGNIEMRDKYV